MQDAIDSDFRCFGKPPRESASAQVGIKDAIRILNGLEKPVVLIGHSWGGSDAIAHAKWARDNGLKVDYLVTIDPVGNPNYFRLGTGTYRGIAGRWVSIVANKDGWMNGGDVVANVWGKTPLSIQRRADKLIIDNKADHADFGAMMRRWKVEDRIKKVYSGK
jgi:pimeloyl-ACP methyl ester carboxylesterase